MRAVILGLILLTAGCDASVNVSNKGDGAPSGYTLEVRADEAEQTFLVTAPDGRVAAARAANGASALLDASAIHALAATSPNGDGPAPPEVMALRMPGLNVSVAADPDENENARVNINIGGRTVQVNAQENGPGDADDRAHVLITGASETEARDFVAKADELSPDVQARMLAALGLD